MAGFDADFGEEDWVHWDSMSEKDKFTALANYQAQKGRIFATSREGNFFKRWIWINQQEICF